MLQALFAARSGRDGADTGKGYLVEGRRGICCKFQEVADCRRTGDGDDVDGAVC